jgi:hypothetical protein
MRLRLAFLAPALALTRFSNSNSLSRFNSWLVRRIETFGPGEGEEGRVRTTKT